MGEVIFLFLIIKYICIKDFKLSLISYSAAKIYENSNPYTSKVSTAALLSYNQNISTVLALSFILFGFLAFYRPGLQNWGFGLVFLNIHSNLLLQI